MADRGTGTPREFALYANYPNPFNPVTRMQYAVARTELVNLKVYDVLGNEIATLVNERKPPGVYSVTFDARRLSSGVYFYKLTAGNFAAIRKMLLLP